MQEARKLVEYGVPIDPEVMVSPPEATELELEPGHPGLGDELYVQRRKTLFALCRRHRLEQLGPPLIEYTDEETRIWRDVSPKLNELHVRHACQIYLAAKRDLSINQQEIPQLRTLSERVQRETNMHLVPAEGCAAVSHLLPVHRRARFPGDAVHSSRLAPGIHARARHDSRLPRTCSAADEPRLRRAAGADREGRLRDTTPANTCWRSRGSAGSASSSG